MPVRSWRRIPLVRIVQWIERLATDQQMRVQVLLRTPFRADDRELLRNKTLSIAPCSFPRPPARPFYQDIAQPDRARARGARGQGFEPLSPEKFRKSSLNQSADNIQCTPCSCKRAAANWVTRESELWVQPPPLSSFQTGHSSARQSACSGSTRPRDRSPFS